MYYTVFCVLPSSGIDLQCAFTNQLSIIDFLKNNRFQSVWVYAVYPHKGGEPTVRNVLSMKTKLGSFMREYVSEVDYD